MSNSEAQNRVIRCEVFSRVVGYHRPIQSWNSGKQSEFNERLSFDEEKSILSPLAPNQLLKETILTASTNPC